MSEYQDTMERLEEMRSRYDDGFSSSDRQFLEKLYYSLYVKKIAKTGCSDCYRDAYILCVTKLKKLKSMPAKPNYILKAGAMIHPVGTSKFYTNPITDEVAEDWLSKFPGQIGMFAEYPEDWEERVAKYKAEKEAEENAKEAVGSADGESNSQLAEELEAVKAELQREKETNADLTKQLEETKATLDGTVSLNHELEIANKELVALKDDHAKLRAEYRGLKSAYSRLKNSSETDEKENDAEEAVNPQSEGEAAKVE